MSTQGALAGIAEAAGTIAEAMEMDSLFLSPDHRVGLESTEIGEVSGNLQKADGEVQITGIGNSFVGSLKSPIVGVMVGVGEEKTIFYAHEKFLLQSTFFQRALAAPNADGGTRCIDLPHEDLGAIGSLLEFLYTGEYYPRKIGDVLEKTSTSEMDDGNELLRHARVYTLANKLELAGLKSLAHSKVEFVRSTAKGEIEYARYIYANTPKSDTAIRKPIANYWGRRSHILRHDAEEEFRKLCTDIPEFGFDVLTQVLDSRERKSKEKERERESTAATRVDTPKPGRKRMRQI